MHDTEARKTNDKLKAKDGNNKKNITKTKSLKE